MSRLVADGEKRYTEANSPELHRAYEQRITEIKRRYAVPARGVLARCTRFLAVQREISRAKREVFGKDSLYLTHS